MPRNQRAALTLHASRGFPKLLADAGVERAIFWLPSAGADKVMPELERLAASLKT